MQSQFAPPSTSFWAVFPASQPFFNWADSTAVCNYIKGTTWIFPLVETIHILALVVLLGTMLMINFRLLGISAKGWTPYQLFAQLKPYMTVGLITILTTGLILFWAEPRKSFENAAFFPKMAMLLASVIYQLTIYPKVASIDKTKVPMWGKLGGLLSIGLWFGVGIAGRAIGFV
jgi:hypothetical protein